MLITCLFNAFSIHADDSSLPPCEINTSFSILSAKETKSKISAEESCVTPTRQDTEDSGTASDHHECHLAHCAFTLADEILLVRSDLFQTSAPEILSQLDGLSRDSLLKPPKPFI